MHRMVNGVQVAMTADEIAAFELERTPTLAEAKRAKKAAILRRWEKSEASGVEYQSKTIETDVASLARLGVLARRARQAVADSESFSVAIVAADDSILNLSRTEILELDKVIGDKFKACADNAKTLRQAVNAAADLAAVAAVDISAGW